MNMKRMLYRLILLTFMLGTYSCMNDISEEYPDIHVSKGQKISIRVSMPQNEARENNSRVSFNDSDLGLTWEEGDQLALIGYNQANTIVGKQILNLESKNGNKAEFSGNTVTGATHYDVYYPAKAVDNKGIASINYNQQVQNGNNNTAHLRNSMLLKQTGDKLTTEEILAEKNDVPMQLQNSIIKFDLNNIFINKPVALQWEIEEADGNKTTRNLEIKNISNDLCETFTGYLSMPNLSVSAKSITVSLIGQKEDSTPYRPMNYHIDLNKNITYTANNRYTALIEKGWIYKIYYKSNLNINESFKNNSSLKEMIAKEEYDESTQWGYIDLKQDKDVALKNLRIPTIKKEIEYLDIYGISGVGIRAFKGCSSLRSVVLHAGVNIIEGHAFEGCKVLSTIRLNEGLQTIENNAFHGCESLEQITIPESVTTIRQFAFAQCIKLKSITIPCNVTSIGSKIFEGSDVLRSVTLESTTPPSITGTGTKGNLLAFKYLENIKIYVPSASLNQYKTADGWKDYADKIFPIN